MIYVNDTPGAGSAPPESNGKGANRRRHRKNGSLSGFSPVIVVLTRIKDALRGGHAVKPIHQMALVWIADRMWPSDSLRVFECTERLASIADASGISEDTLSDALKVGVPLGIIDGNERRSTRRDGVTRRISNRIVLNPLREGGRKSAASGFTPECQTAAGGGSATAAGGSIRTPLTSPSYGSSPLRGGDSSEGKATQLGSTPSSMSKAVEHVRSEIPGGLEIPGAAARRPTYVEAAVALWEGRFGAGSGQLMIGRIGKRLKPLVEAHGESAVLEAFANYLERSLSKDDQWVTPEAFAGKYLAYVPTRQPVQKTREQEREEMLAEMDRRDREAARLRAERRARMTPEELEADDRAEAQATQTAERFLQERERRANLTPEERMREDREYQNARRLERSRPPAAA